MKKNSKYKKDFEKDQKIIKSFDKLYRKSFQYNMIDKNEDESLFIIFSKYLDDMKNESFL